MQCSLKKYHLKNNIFLEAKHIPSIIKASHQTGVYLWLNSIYAPILNSSVILDLIVMPILSGEKRTSVPFAAYKSLLLIDDNMEAMTRVQ